ncbi:MAG: hypothetical protein IKO94_02075 [Selenomonadaceae bacterium]|nr:hypothetical protein [Selenomonadaceae bacterium]
MGILKQYIEDAVKSKNKSPAEWLTEVVQNAGKCLLATNVGKFSNPGIGTDVSIYVPQEDGAAGEDGYVHTGNVACRRDVVVASAAYLGTPKLLTLRLEDGRTVFEHFQEDSDVLRRELSAIPVDYDSIREAVLELAPAGVPSGSDERLRQVFFPVGDGKYHLLSVLPSSSLLMEQGRRIRGMNQERREARDKKSERYGDDYASIPGIVEEGFGGTKPQNISFLNNAASGRAYLLPSIPPGLWKREIRVPKKDFFRNSLVLRDCWGLFRNLHRCYMDARHNLQIRTSARLAEHEIIDYVFLAAEQIRADQEEGWSEDAECAIPMEQKIWLDEKYADSREEAEWKEQIAASVARWMFWAYGKVLREKKLVLGDAEFAVVRDEIRELL